MDIKETEDPVIGLQDAPILPCLPLKRTISPSSLTFLKEPTALFRARCSFRVGSPTTPVLSIL